MFRLVLLLATLMLVACTPTSITISLGVPSAMPTATLTPLPSVTPTSTPDFAATAQVQASATAQARLTADAREIATAQAEVTGTAQARMSAIAAAMTLQANSTATAQAAAAATKNALLAYVDALLQKGYKPVRLPDGQLGGGSSKLLDTSLYPKNFAADIEFSNPADPQIHPWDLMFMFRYASVENRYFLVLYSNGTWSLLYPAQRQADRTTTERIANGVMPTMNLSPTGSNKVRFVANENTGFLFVNGELVGMMDLSKNLSSGELLISTGQMIGDDFPGLVMPYKNLVITGLP